MRVWLLALVAVAGSGVCEAQGAVSNADAESVTSQIESSVNGKGLVPIYPIRTAQLAAGNVERIRIPLDLQSELTISTACGEKCDDIDLEATDEAGNVLAYDESLNASLLLHVAAGKTKVVLLQVKMVECSQASCAYGAGLFQSAADINDKVQKTYNAITSLLP